MTTREKIIIGFMCVTIAYGAYELLSSDAAQKKPPGATTNSSLELQNTVAKISQQLVKPETQRDRQYMASSAAVEWPKDPFIQSTEPLKKHWPPRLKRKRPLPRPAIPST